MLLFVLTGLLAPVLASYDPERGLHPRCAATAAFLGLGVTPLTADWGSMLQNSLSWARMAPHVMLFPGLALMLVVFGFNIFGDGLRDALDPRLRER